MVNTTRPYDAPDELPPREKKRKRGRTVEVPEAQKPELKPDNAYTPQAEDLHLIET